MKGEKNESYRATPPLSAILILSIVGPLTMFR